jgi:hypothetical protein
MLRDSSFSFQIARNETALLFAVLVPGTSTGTTGSTSTW